ncbi:MULTISPECIES: DUF3592 domain-containing protein [Mesorhizobium]|uniref:DUF3592 domain-containing protein n=1 Tax=Mesorhizobium sp. TaxID=1871066 RepID=UPI0004947C56|nr:MULTISPECIES: DUF3592 domain-containing protein [Mesorhizobium]RWM69797.1 MAG: hypothetical protein EOR82_22570 [Mesorhizobium sp.]TIO23113.1 MAG: hypothetical protein E5X83_22195 [Mesorhizobium sp.]TJV56543.1 MAG: hypothetical protein E5X82_23335 [Mesorhizobium sp.]
MTSTTPFWFDVVFLAAVVFIAGVFVLGSLQERKFARRAEHWPVIESTAVERLFLSADPTTYRIRVKYVFQGAEYTSVAENFFQKQSTNKYVGDVVMIKVNPENPAISVLYS